MNFANDFLPNIVNTAIIIPASALFLWIISKVLKLDENSYKTALKISFIIFGWTFLINILKNFVSSITYLYFFLSIINYLAIFLYLALKLIKKEYNLDKSDTFTVWLIWMSLWFIVGLAITYAISGVILAIIPIS